MNTQKYLQNIFAGCIGLPLFAVLLFETDLLPGGCLAGEAQIEFLSVLLCELLTLGSIPVALRLIRPKNQKKITDISELNSFYRCRATWRLLLLGVPLLLNTLLYYLLMSPTLGYLSLILAACLFFVLPTQARVEQETQYYSSQSNTSDE
ncbi:MAG: hypothetical protein SO013_01985 [Prevotella sp.]|nr:hypothetical protein [Prevotellaceae bacterium]MDY3364744.1 hypothetical protein [Prevotella sp.]MDY3851646.1 hypothetical protein [Prevotella sp.]